MGHLAQTHYILQSSHLYFCPSPQGKFLQSLTWIFFLLQAAWGLVGHWLSCASWARGRHWGVGGFIVSSRCWSGQDGWVRLESDTYSQISHRAPLYIDPYYQSQIAIALALPGNAAGEIQRSKYSPLIVHSTSTYEVILNIEGVCVCFCANATVRCSWGATGQRLTCNFDSSHVLAR